MPVRAGRRRPQVEDQESGASSVWSAGRPRSGRRLCRRGECPHEVGRPRVAGLARERAPDRSSAARSSRTSGSGRRRRGGRRSISAPCTAARRDRRPRPYRRARATHRRKQARRRSQPRVAPPAPDRTPRRPVEGEQVLVVESGPAQGQLERARGFGAQQRPDLHVDPDLRATDREPAPETAAYWRVQDVSLTAPTAGTVSRIGDTATAVPPPAPSRCLNSARQQPPVSAPAASPPSGCRAAGHRTGPRDSYTTSEDAACVSGDRSASGKHADAGQCRCLVV
jgi:hypothetical protein